MTTEEFRISSSRAVAEDDFEICKPHAEGGYELTNEGLDRLTDIADAQAEPLFERIAELAMALDKAERMITYTASVFYLKDIQNHLPFGMADEVKAYIRDSGQAQDLIRKAKGEGK